MTIDLTLDQMFELWPKRSITPAKITYNPRGEDGISLTRKANEVACTISTYEDTDVPEAVVLRVDEVLPTPADKVLYGSRVQAVKVLRCMLLSDGRTQGLEKPGMLGAPINTEDGNKITLFPGFRWSPKSFMSSEPTPGEIVLVKYDAEAPLCGPWLCGEFIGYPARTPQIFPNMTVGGSIIDMFENAIPNIMGGSQFSATPQEPAQGAVEFVRKMKESGYFTGFSDQFLCGLAANAQHESGFKNAAQGDKRSSSGGNGALAINNYCSFGYWQLNVCATDGGGQRFAAFHNIELTDKAVLLPAITDSNKQFQFVAQDMRRLFGSLVSDPNATAEQCAQQIAVKFEVCFACKPAGSSPPAGYISKYPWNYSQTVKRGAIAAGLYPKIVAEAEASSYLEEQEQISSASPPADTPYPT